ncbi:MAG TPA: ATPase, partial [Firmicutes bacterium]|nr:ATPase [Bacillota bacterium]
ALIGLDSPLIAIHLLWVNLITDSLPAVALGADKKPDDIMDDKPRDPKESLFSHGGYAITFGYGLVIGLITLAAFLLKPIMAGNYTLADISSYLNYIDPVTNKPLQLEEAQSMAFCVLAMSELFHMLGMTNTKKSFINVFKDKNVLLWIAFFLGMGLQFAVIEIPGVNDIFKVYRLSDEPMDYLYVFVLALMPLVVHEITVFVLFIKKHLQKNRA